MALRVHISLNVKDLDQSVNFYRKMFAEEPVKVRPGYAKFHVADPPINFALNEVKNLEKSRHLSHLGIQVATTDEVMATRKRWQEAELLPKDEMGVNCCYARQDKSWVHDPDGNEWEVFTVLEDTEQAVDQTGACACAS